MNILFLSSKSPYPIKDGHSMRTFNLLKRMAKNHRVFLLTYFLSKDEEEEFEELRRICFSAEGFKLPSGGSTFLLAISLFKNLFSPLPFVAQKYRSREMLARIKQKLKDEKIDLIHVDILPLMNYSAVFDHYPVLLVEHNVESLLLRRMITHTRNLILKFFLWLQYAKLSLFETKQIGNADCVAAVSEEERGILISMNPDARVELVPNGVDSDFFQPAAEDKARNSIIFVGGLNWFPNLDGISYFCEQIQPVIRLRVGEFSTVIVGKEDKGFRYASSITQTGFVKDIRSFVYAAKVFIVPLRIGGGTRLKILDAMAMGKAIVSTSIGCEGLAVKNGIHLIIEDDPRRFAEAIVELLVNDQKRLALGKNARQLVEEKYDWGIIARGLDGIYENLRKKNVRNLRTI